MNLLLVGIQFRPLFELELFFYFHQNESKLTTMIHSEATS